MIRSVASKVMWVGRATVFLVGLAVILALVFGVASTAFAHGGYKGLLHLGHSKAVAKVTTLVGQVATGSALVVSNPSGGSALGLEVNAGKAPLTVNADAGKATNLDADKLDGKSSAEFAPDANQNGKADAAEQADTATNAGNADTVDGKHAADFYAAGSKVADSDKLDGKDSTQLGVNGLQRVTASSAHDSTSSKGATAYCPSGKVVVGTGYDIIGGKTGNYPNALTDVVVDDVIPNPADNPTNVLVAAYEEEATTDNWRVTAYAICAKAP